MLAWPAVAAAVADFAVSCSIRRKLTSASSIIAQATDVPLSLQPASRHVQLRLFPRKQHRLETCIGVHLHSKLPAGSFGRLPAVAPRLKRAADSAAARCADAKRASQPTQTPIFDVCVHIGRMMLWRLDETREHVALCCSAKERLGSWAKLTTNTATKGLQ